MGKRVESETLFLRHEFTRDERLEMGQKLAEAYNRIAEIEEEAKVIKDQIKERTSQVEATIGSLSRNLANGFTMENVSCELIFDSPHVGEVTYKRKDNGEFAKVRAMTDAERQMDLPLAGDVLVVTPDESAKNIAGFFDPQAIAKAAEEGAEPDPAPQPEDPFTSDEPDAAFEAIKPEHDAEFDGVTDAPEAEQGPSPAKPKRLKGFSKPTNISAF